MLSGSLQGQFLTFLSKMIQPEAILEIGTFTGYAAICMAQGLSERGTLHSIETNRELEYIIRKYIRLADLEEKIVLHIGNAKTIIPQLEKRWDLVFIDAGKWHNAFYYDLIIDRVQPGGLILIDNVLWSGKVLQPAQDKDAAAIHQFNEKVQADKRVENVLLPLRDGLMIVRRL